MGVYRCEEITQINPIRHVVGGLEYRTLRIV